MTKTELDWISSAMVILDNGELSKVKETKVLRTIAQIFEKDAVAAEIAIMDQNNQVSVNDYFYQN